MKMKKAAIQSAALGLAMILLGGCAINVLDGTPDSPSASVCMADALEEAKADIEKKIEDFKEIKKAKVKNMEKLKAMVQAYRALKEDVRDLKQVDSFLNCYIGPDKGTLVQSGAEATPEEKEKAKELSLFRGHIIVTLLARYGALNVTGQFGREKIKFSTYDGLDEDAGDIITSIRRAEAKLRIGSKIREHVTLKNKLISNDPTAKIPFPSYIKEGALEQFDVDAKRDRVLAVSKLLIDVETPTFERAKNWFLNLISFAQTPTFSKGRQALKDAANGFKKLSVVSRFRVPYYKGVRNQLNELRGKDIAFTHWKEWDKFLLEACLRIQERAGTLESCIP